MPDLNSVDNNCTTLGPSSHILRAFSAVVKAKMDKALKMQKSLSFSLSPLLLAFVLVHHHHRVNPSPLYPLPREGL